MMANFDDLFTTPAAPEPPSVPPQLTKEEYAAKKKAERDDLYALADEMAHEIMQDTETPSGVFWMCRHALTAARPPMPC